MTAVSNLYVFFITLVQRNRDRGFCNVHFNPLQGGVGPQGARGDSGRRGPTVKPTNHSLPVTVILLTEFLTVINLDVIHDFFSKCDLLVQGNRHKSYFVYASLSVISCNLCKNR